MPVIAHADVCQSQELLSCCPGCKAAFWRQLDIYELYIYPAVVHFGCLSTNFYDFPFVGVLLSVRGKAEDVSRRISTYARDIKHTDDTLPNLVRGSSECSS